MSKKKPRNASRAQGRGNNGNGGGSRSSGDKRSGVQGKPKKVPPKQDQPFCQWVPRQERRHERDAMQPAPETASLYTAFEQLVQIMIEQKEDVSPRWFLRALEEVGKLFKLDHAPGLAELKALVGAEVQKDSSLKGIPSFFSASAFLFSEELRHRLKLDYKGHWYRREPISTAVGTKSSGQKEGDVDLDQGDGWYVPSADKAPALDGVWFGGVDAGLAVSDQGDCPGVPVTALRFPALVENCRVGRALSDLGFICPEICDIGESDLTANARERLEFLRADSSGDSLTAGEIAYIEQFLATTV